MKAAKVRSNSQKILGENDRIHFGRNHLFAWIFSKCFTWQNVTTFCWTKNLQEISIRCWSCLSVNFHLCPTLLLCNRNSSSPLCLHRCKYQSKFIIVAKSFRKTGCSKLICFSIETVHSAPCALLLGLMIIFYSQMRLRVWSTPDMKSGLFFATVSQKSGQIEQLNASNSYQWMEK